MNREYLIQRDALLEDYRNASERLTINIDESADQVLSQLNETQEEHYATSTSDAKGNVSYRFPFNRRIYSGENDGILSTEYIHEGQPYVLEADDDLQRQFLKRPPIPKW